MPAQGVLMPDTLSGATTGGCPYRSYGYAIRPQRLHVKACDVPYCELLTQDVLSQRFLHPDDIGAPFEFTLDGH